MADDGKPLDLYDTDFFAWTQAQAAALHAQSAGAVDWARVAQEIEDMGRSDLRECYSRLETIIEHLMKLHAAARAEPRAGWRSTIVRARAGLELVLTPSLRRQLAATLEERHVRAARLAAASLAEHEPDRTINAAQRWPLAALLGETDDPLAGC